VCLGRFLADESLFITISRLLSAFDIKKAVDEHGDDIEPEISVTPGMIAHINDYPYDIKPRNEKCVDMIKQVQVEYPWEEGDARFL
jgi:hypothetical protein